MRDLSTSLESLIGGLHPIPVLAGEAGAEIYRIETVGYLKTGRGPVARDIGDEFARLSWLRERTPVPEVLHFTANSDQAWLLTSAVRGETIDDLLENGGADAAEMAGAAGRFLRALHDPPGDDCPFEAGHSLRLHAARSNVAAGRVDEDDFGTAQTGWSAQQVLDAIQALLPLPMERVLTHGDFSTGNILFADGAVSGMIDVGRAGLADPYQDIAILLGNLEDRPAAAKAFLAGYGLAEPDERRLRFHSLLDELF